MTAARRPPVLRAAGWLASLRVGVAVTLALTGSLAVAASCALDGRQARADVSLNADPAVQARAQSQLADLNGQAALPVQTLAELLDLPLTHDAGHGLERWNVTLDGVSLTVTPDATIRVNVACVNGVGASATDPEAAFRDPESGLVYVPISTFEPFWVSVELAERGVTVNTLGGMLSLGPLSRSLPSIGSTLAGWRNAAAGAILLDGAYAFPLALALAADDDLWFLRDDGQLLAAGNIVAGLYDDTPASLVTWNGGAFAPLAALQAAGLNARLQAGSLMMSAGGLEFALPLPEFPSRVRYTSLKLEQTQVTRTLAELRLVSYWRPVFDAAILVDGQPYLPFTPTAARTDGLSLSAGGTLDLNGSALSWLYAPAQAGQGLVRYAGATYLPAAVLPTMNPAPGGANVTEAYATTLLTVPSKAPRLSFGALRSAGRPPTAPVKYVVRAGDTLFNLAAHYGVSVQALKEANHLTGGALRAGQALVIPGSR